MIVKYPHAGGAVAVAAVNRWWYIFLEDNAKMHTSEHKFNVHK